MSPRVTFVSEEIEEVSNTQWTPQGRSQVVSSGAGPEMH